ncbi:MULTISPECIES: hypothetical protein [Bacteroidales]|uniref:hypothetical protein n=1 Tax=Bacteroidales TaxID=171549 RepID=UPI0013150B47|nr:MULTISPECIES: hypothetical protein [Bacteroidales]MDB8902634.1 hypothetical protein [Parabacteroides merdae]MDB8905897.1 hypothetical protein [Parabacteroides merdae]
MEGNSNNTHPHGIPTSFSQRKANDRSVALKRKSCLSEASSFSLAKRRKRVAEKMQS